MSRIVVFFFCIPLTIQTMAQGPSFLRGSLNSRSINNIYPAVSGDGNTLIYMDNYTDDGSYEFRYSRKERGLWSSSQNFDAIRSAKIAMDGGYALNFDGSLLIYAARGEGVGGFDLWWSQYNGEKWSSPSNFGAPLNSALHDTYPSISADGNTLYFTRCQSFDGNKGIDCTIWRVERNPSVALNWRNPVELSSNINNPNASMPKILADNQTLYFYSGTDWYLTRKQDGDWVPPMMMGFLSGIEGKEYVTAYYRPDRLITAAKNELGNFNLGEIVIPPPFQPANVVIKYGTVTGGSGQPLGADIRLVDYNSGELVSHSRSESQTGSYTFIIPEGRVYDFSVQPRRGDELYYAEIMDFEELRTSKRESQNFLLESIEDGTYMRLGVVQFSPNTTELDSRSGPEIGRLTKLLLRNKNFSIEIGAYQDSVITDSIPRPELTEVMTDTIYTYEYVAGLQGELLISAFSQLETVQMDSLIMIWNDSLSVINNGNDTLLVNYLIASFVGLDSIEHMALTQVYHNDITQMRAQALADRLVAEGVQKSRITFNGYGDERKPNLAVKPEDWENGVLEMVFFN